MRRRPTPLAVTAAFLVVPLLAACTHGDPDQVQPTTTTDTSTGLATASTPAAPPATTASSEPPTSTTAPPTSSAPSSTVPTVPGGATPQITYAGPGAAAGTYDFSGIVLGVIEDGGRCTFTLTPDHGSPVVALNSGIDDASSTSCGTLTLDADKLTAGTWHVTLTYVGSKQGTSASTTLAVG